eukprot:UN00735
MTPRPLKIIFEITFSKTSVLKMNTENTFLAYCEFIKANYYILSLETKSLDA